MTSKCYDIVIVGGGIVGLATALALSGRTRASLMVIEAEDHLAAHQTGNNSGVIHSGLYYRPGSLKARNCVEGREAMYRFCQEHGIAHDRCGKIVVATREEELPALEELERRGAANGLKGLKRLSPEEIREHEPHVAGVAGLLIPETGIVDFVQVAGAYAKVFTERGGEIRKSTRLTGLRVMESEFMLRTSSGEIRCRHLINCAGLQCDRVAQMCGIDPRLKIVPFRGEYYELAPGRRSLVRNLIYPVPDPEFPFLGAHFTRMIQGGVEAGPNAVLAFQREGYRKTSFSLADTLDTFLYSGFQKMAFRYWKMGLGEFYRSLSKSAFVRALQRLIPELSMADLHPAGAGVRAQAIEPDGKLVDDFRIVQGDGMIHVLNAPSPAATASLSIGETLAEIALKSFDIQPI